MKKRIIVLFCSLACSLVFAGGFTDSKVFDSSYISSLNISLENENITISTSRDNTIYVISETYSKSIFPDVKVEGNELKIMTEGNLNSKDFCYISLIIPEGFAADKVTVNIKNGELNIKKMTAKNVVLIPGEKNSLENIKADYFEIPVNNQADMNISNLDSKEINISLLAGDLNLSLLHLPEKNSKISAKHGKLNISFPKHESFTVNARSFNSSFINNLNNSVTDWVREGKVYKHNGGGVELLLQTHNGDIVISE